MNRTAAAALVALAAAACGPTSPPLADVTIYWEFDRNTLIDGVIGIRPYDTLVNWPPGTGSRACPESGVDFVVVTDTSGNPFTGSVPCINQSVQGAPILGFQGPATYVVTGWRTGVALPVFSGQVTVNAVPGVFNFGTAVAAGIPSNLTIDMVLADANAPLGYPTCGLARVDQFESWVEDGFGTLVWRNVINCGPSFMPSIQYGGVDRDNLFIWIDTYDNTFAPPDIPWSICELGSPNGILHFQNTLFSQRIPQGICTPAPPALRAMK
jgi:hypothetical protein